MEIANTNTQRAYDNPGGPGPVLETRWVTEELARLFQEKAEWSNVELVERVGWRFGSGIHILRRRRGWGIKTIKGPGTRNFSYRFDGKVTPVEDQDTGTDCGCWDE